MRNHFSMHRNSFFMPLTLSVCAYWKNNRKLFRISLKSPQIHVMDSNDDDDDKISFYSYPCSTFPYWLWTFLLICVLCWVWEERKGNRTWKSIDPFIKIHWNCTFVFSFYPLFVRHIKRGQHIMCVDAHWRKQMEYFFLFPSTMGIIIIICVLSHPFVRLSFYFNTQRILFIWKKRGKMDLCCRSDLGKK